ncbi:MULTISPECIES: outer membrane protein assembly factor BamB [Tenebrionibacter/Tenebrionicola group]|jgi:outer membrane protein assembly factor BamB|uniref:Outer membrane protein assembly factor BamB n=2 Tax=Tenebrionibacter/Tenebrionicola group TaxID=2969848 RepID=A0A8K0XY44_9ENTR|nr:MULTISPECIES: outer membrane protein assembly factor BamB [Tenebrionibacter/Tenebrionicola group]MBK4716027.1 outer membrane protein assembly factor BamB [Tenebrionibacter intestinalis]MBV4411746.1 outer membrane protein assembly factor BamB [Tenebrionicola larvae]MBV5096783.1 outer membrane protein assembly factor BamB [Tenebrionicola larvae]
MQLRNLFMPGLLSLTLLSGCSLFNSEEDVVQMAPLPQVNNQFTPQTAWKTSVGDGIGDFYSNLHPAALEGTVYAADRFGKVKAMDGRNGKEIWSVDLSEKTGFFSRNRSALLSGGVAVSASHLYIGSEKAQVYALNTADGTLAWQVRVAGEVLASPVISDGLVLIHTSNGMLQALSESDGSVKWTVNLDVSALSLRGESSPATAFGAAIIGGDNGRVSAVMMDQGQLIWQQRIARTTGATEIDRLSDVDASPVVQNGVVYAIAYNGDMVALDLRTGQIMWKRELGSVNGFIIDGDRMYLVDQSDRVLALGTEGGVTLWSQNGLLHRNLTRPALFNGYLIVGDSEGYVHWLDTTNGSFVAQQKLDSSGFQTEPVPANDKLLIQAKDGTLYSLSR